MKKYEFTGETMFWFGRTLRRIRALIRIERFDINPGDLGGWVENETNLTHEGDAWVSDNARVYGDALVSGNARVYGDAWVSDNARVYGDALVSGNARVSGDALVSGNARVYGDARVYGNAWVSDNARVYGDAWVKCVNDIITVGPIGSRNDTTTFFRNKSGTINVKCGCFLGTVDEFKAKVELTHGDSRHGKVYRLAAEMAITQMMGDKKNVE